jgi:hypothetical protein
MSPDLTVRPPRSARTRLGGFVLLPRILDKCRAELTGKNGDYHYNCPMDRHFLTFTGLEAKSLKAKVAQGFGDAEILLWVLEHAVPERAAWEISQWSAWQEARTPSDNESREYYSELVAKAKGAARTDIATWFDYLDFDDYVSFGGKP